MHLFELRFYDHLHVAEFHIWIGETAIGIAVLAVFMALRTILFGAEDLILIQRHAATLAIVYGAHVV